MLRHPDNGSNHRCLTALVRKRRPLWGSSLRKCGCASQRLSALQQMNMFFRQQDPNIHEREMWIKCCVMPVTAVTMPSWVTWSSGGTRPFNLCGYRSHSHIVLHEHCTFLTSQHLPSCSVRGLHLTDQTNIWVWVISVKETISKI